LSGRGGSTTRHSAGRYVRILLWVCVVAQQAVTARTPTPLSERIDNLTGLLEPDTLEQARYEDRSAMPSVSLQIEGCRGYPYQAERAVDEAHAALVTDLREGLATGLQCLVGLGPMGRLHPYHEYQAHRLLSLFEEPVPKTLRCVDDEMFPTAIATGPGRRNPDDPMARPLSLVEHPGIVIDTYRLGGLLSRRHDDETYRSFFHLSEPQIYEHRYGQPMRARSLHRFENRPALLFHEMTHWLGHTHSALNPDVTHLYETCCFGGSDYIDDPERNAYHQKRACEILRDDALWHSGYSPYRQMREWHIKGYGQLKRAMRADYGR
jgi:hypothetical protein